MMLSAHLISCVKKFHNEVDAASTNRFKCYSFIIFGTVNLMISNDDWDGTSLKNPINKKDASQWRALNTNSKIFNCTRLMIGSHGSAGLVERVSNVHVEELLLQHELMHSGLAAANVWTLLLDLYNMDLFHRPCLCY